MYLEDTSFFYGERGISWSGSMCSSCGDEKSLGVLVIWIISMINFTNKFEFFIRLPQLRAKPPKWPHHIHVTKTSNLCQNLALIRLTARAGVWEHDMLLWKNYYLFKTIFVSIGADNA